MPDSRSHSAGGAPKSRSDPANAKMANVGDSASGRRDGASTMFSVLHALHQPVRALCGGGSSRTASRTASPAELTALTSAQCDAASDVWPGIYGRDIPAVQISAVVNATTATLSQAASRRQRARVLGRAAHHRGRQPTA